MKDDTISIRNRPIKKFRSGAIDGAVWSNVKKMENGDEVEFKTATLRRSWMDKEKEIWRDEKINLRKGDVQRSILILQKLQEELLLTKPEESG